MKSYGKSKTLRDKSRKSKRETLDDVPTIKKSTEEKNKAKKSGKAGNLPRKKKVTGTSSIGDLSLHLEEVVNPLKPQTFVEEHSDVHRVKGKKRVSKSCEETVSHAVSEFFEGAWKACVERFFIQTAPVTVSFELRNTWLRLVEAEWQDPDMREKPSTKPNRIFKRDDPPLPLAFDTWSRGVIETMPSVRRESILDPFIRDFDPFGNISFPARHPSPSIISLADDMDEDESASPDGGEAQTEAQEQETPEEEMEQTDQPAEAAKTSGENNVTDGEPWDFELDPVLANNVLEQQSSAMRSSVGSLTESQYSEEHVEEKSHFKHKDKHIHTVLSARPFTWDESTTDFDYSTPTHSSGKSARIIKSSIRPKPVHNFSPSQCGGRVGSGVFRLPLETTSAALRKLRGPHDPNERPQQPSLSRILEQHADDRADIVQVSTKGHISQPEEDELEVLPLFEENTTRGHALEDHNQEDKVWKRRSVSELRFKELALEEVASDHDKRQVRRRLINLHSRFKRQAMRSLAAKIRRGEAAMKPQLSNETVAESAASSVHSSSNKTNITKNKKLGSRASRSASIPNNLQLTQSKRMTKQTQDFTNYLSDVAEAAKGAPSEPLLHAIIKEHQQKHEEQEAKDLERRIRSLGRNNRKIMGNVRTSSQRSDRLSFGSFSASGPRRLNPKEMEKVGGRGRGSPQCQNGRPSNRRIICDYNNYDPCSLQPAPSDCRSAGTCSNITSPP